MSWEISIVATTLDEAQRLLAIADSVGVQAELIAAQVLPTRPGGGDSVTPRLHVDMVDGYRVVFSAAGLPARVDQMWHQIDAAIGQVIGHR